MSRNLTIGALLILATAGLYVVTMMVRSGDPPPAAPSFTVPGTPAAIYDAILPEIRERVARDTRIVRIDSASGTMTMRFSAYLEDHSVRLVEVALAPSPPGETVVTVLSRPFSFLPGRPRDEQDGTLEASLVALIRRRIADIAPAPG